MKVPAWNKVARFLMNQSKIDDLGLPTGFGVIFIGDFSAILLTNAMDKVGLLVKI